MPRLLVLALAAALLVLPGTATVQAAPPPVHDIAVSGTGVSMTPGFDPAIERYALDTTAATGGSVTVTATTSDAHGSVLVNGRPTSGGSRTITGLAAGDEISVIVRDSSGTAVHSLVFLPADFPRLTTVIDEPGTTPGEVMLTLAKWVTPAPSYEVAIDRNGVPTYVREFPVGASTMDLKPAPDGHYTVFRGPTPTAGKAGAQAVELDESFQPVRTMETVGLVHTDAHDLILRPDGSRVMLAYEPNPDTGLDDAVIQEVDADGTVVYTWNSSEHWDDPQAETTHTPGAADYAHVNSIEEMADGDILASFRHTSSVMKIAWSDHDDYDRGDVVWRLGGRLSDFEFVDDLYPSGPCAQHTASELPNGNILIFDNGGGAIGASPSLCVNPADPTGPTINRVQTRVTEYSLDEQAGTATLVWDYEPAGRFALFAGSVRRLPGGNTLVGWASAQQATATELDPEGVPVWEVMTGDGYFTYRAAKAVLPDAIEPEVQVSVPAQDATYDHGQRVVPVVTCTDRGGSSLHSCTASQAALDTRTPGQHTYRVTASDGDGNTTTVTRQYTVAGPVFRPDAAIRGKRAWKGDDVYGGRSQRIMVKLGPSRTPRARVVRLENDGDRDRLVVSGAGSGRGFAVRYRYDGRDVTRKVMAGTFRTPRLDRGASVKLTLVVERLRSVRPGRERTLRVKVASAGNHRRRDWVAAVVRTTR